jgi:hypothetical protein
MFAKHIIKIIFQKLTPAIQNKVLAFASLIQPALIHDTWLVDIAMFTVSRITPRSSYQQPTI